jgi:hypothetical protein
MGWRHLITGFRKQGGGILPPNSQQQKKTQKKHIRRESCLPVKDSFAMNLQETD